MTSPTTTHQHSITPTESRGWETALSELREMVETAKHGNYDLKVRARKVFQSLPTAEVFMEIYIASFRTKDPEGWFFKTYDWWWEHHGLSESNVKTGVRKLEQVGLVEKKNGLGNRMYFRLLPAAVIETLYADTDQPLALRSDPKNSQIRAVDAPVLTDPPNRTSDSTEQKRQTAGTETISRRLPYRRNERDDVEKQKSLDDSPKNSSHDGHDHSPPLQERQRARNSASSRSTSRSRSATADYLTRWVDKRLIEKYGTGLTSGQREFFQKDFSRLESELSYDDLKLAAEGIVKWLPKWQRIPVEEALQKMYFEPTETATAERAKKKSIYDGPGGQIDIA